MINPECITNFNQTQYELEEVLAFWVLVAGKPAAVISKALEKLLVQIEGWYPKDSAERRPFEMIQVLGEQYLPLILKSHGIGCYNLKAKGLWALSKSGLNLKTCTLDDLTSIPGIGPKTARCFLIHSRPDCEYAGLDTHVLKFMRDLGFEAPTSTPGSKRQYRELEKVFVSICKAMNVNVPVANFDLLVWRIYRGQNKQIRDEVLNKFKKILPKAESIRKSMS